MHSLIISAVFTKDLDNTFEAITVKKQLIDMERLNFDIDDIKKRLKKLIIYKSPGPDNINPRILSEASDF